MRPPHARRAEDDFWQPGEAPPFTLGEVIRAAPAGCLLALVLAAIAVAFFVLDVPVEPHPGWW